MRISVLGGGGFIGTHLVRRLVRLGHEVKVFGRSRSMLSGEPEGVEFLEGSFEDVASVSEAVRGVDVVYHLISSSLPRTANRDMSEDVSSNLIGTIKLLEACVERGVKRVVYTSSGGTIYGPAEMLPIPETHPTQPLNSYGVVKLSVEKYLDIFRGLHGLESVVLRISNPFGPYQSTVGGQGVVSTFLGEILNFGSIQIWGDGSAVRDYIYVEDVVEALVLAGELRYESRTPVLNIGSSEGVSLNRLLSYMEEVTGRSVSVDYRRASASDVTQNVLDTTLAKEVLGWEKRTDLFDGLSKTWDWLRYSETGKDR